MVEAAKVINQIGSTSSYNDKLAILKKSESVEGLKDILRFIYNPYVKTRNISAKLLKALCMRKSTEEVVSYKAAIQYFSTYYWRWY